MSGCGISPEYCEQALEKFLKKAHSFNSHQIPENNKLDFDELSQAVIDKYLSNRQTDDVFGEKMKYWRQLNEKLKIKFPNHGLFMTGSTISGFATNKGDLDMSLLQKNSTLSSERLSAIGILESYKKNLERDPEVDRIEMVKGTSPVLIYHYKVKDFTIDMSYNNSVNIRNTHLLCHYSKVDWRVKPLVAIVKYWAKEQDINKPRYKSISSYSLVLMVIHFLQCGTSPAVLPNLQKLFPHKFGIDCDIQSLDYFEKLNIPDEYKNNTQTLGQLFIDFLKYYAFFEYDRYVISLRMGKNIPFDEFMKLSQYTSEPYRWKCLKIEEPYTLTNVARAVHDTYIFSRIKKIFFTSWEALNESHELSVAFKKFLF